MKGLIEKLPRLADTVLRRALSTQGGNKPIYWDIERVKPAAAAPQSTIAGSVDEAENAHIKEVVLKENQEKEWAKSVKKLTAPAAAAPQSTIAGSVDEAENAHIAVVLKKNQDEKWTENLVKTAVQEFESFPIRR